MGYRDYSTAKGHIVDATGKGDFTTIAAALTAASSGQTIFIRPGTYTENPTLKAGVNLSSFEPTTIFGTSGTSPSNVIILGKCSFSSAGSVGIYGITLKTNSDFCLSITGSAASLVTLNNCYIQCSNNTGIQLSSSSASSGINLNYCGGSLDTTGIAIFAHSGAGIMWWTHTQFNNAGSSLTANTISGTGSYHCDFSELFNPITLSSSGGLTGYCSNFGTVGNQTAITTSSTASVQIIHGEIASGTASAISVGAGTTVELHYVLLNSSNATTITGTGTLSFTNIVANSVLSLAAGLTLSNAAMKSFISSGGVGTAGQVFTSNGVSTAPSWQAASAGTVVQQIRANKTAAQTITSNIGAITTTPTTSTGSSVISVSITPTNASHILLIEGNLVCTSAGNSYTAYIIQNGAGNSIASSWQSNGNANNPMTIPVRTYITAGGTSAITFDLYGASVGTNTFVNSNTSGTQLSGGTAFTSLTVTEYTS